MAPSDKKEFRRFQDLMFEVFLPANGTSSLLGVDLHRQLDCESQGPCHYGNLWWTILPATIEQVTAYDVSRYIWAYVRLTWEWIHPYIEQSHQGSVHNTAARLTDRHQKEKEEQKLLIKAQAITVKDYLNVIPLDEALELVKVARKRSVTYQKDHWQTT
jgi:hypothetical protein